MKRKADVENIQLVLIVAICVVGLIFVFVLITKASDEGCKRAQMDELGKIWRELDYWNSKGEVVGRTSYNTIPDFNVKSCVKGITYNKINGKIVVEWTDGSNDDMPAKGKWRLCKPLPPGTYNVKVSFKRVEIIGFCEECKCKDSVDCEKEDCCEKSECVGSVLCGETGACWDGEKYKKRCEWNQWECIGYCAAYCKNTIDNEAFSDCVCGNDHKCKAECKPEEIPDVIPENKDAWTEDSKYLDNWYASSLEYALIEKEMSSDSKVNSLSVHLKTAATPAFSLYAALNGRFVYLPDFKKLHFWFNSLSDGNYFYITFNTGESSWEIKGLSCNLGEFKKGWREYTVVLDPELNPDCEWTSMFRSVKDLEFSFQGTETKIDGLYLCKDC